MKRLATAVRDGKAYPTDVQLASAGGQGGRAGGWVRITKGLDAGDEVAVENGYALPAEFPVTVLPPGTEAPGPGNGRITPSR